MNKTLASIFKSEPMRSVELTGTGYKLKVWDAESRCDTGQRKIAYQFISPNNKVLFKGADCGVAPSNPIDSDDALRGLISFLTLKPGDTDSDYFKDYTKAQLAFAQTKAEDLQYWGYESSEWADFDNEAPEFTNLD